MAKRKVRKPKSNGETVFPEIPKALRVGPVLYDTAVLPADEWKWKNMVGWLSSEKRQLRVLADQSPADVVWTFLHEVFHAAWRDRTHGNAWEALLKTADRAVLVEELEEAVVDSMTPAILDIFVNNPWLLPLMAAYVEHLRTVPNWNGRKVAKNDA